MQQGGETGDSEQKQWVRYHPPHFTTTTTLRGLQYVLRGGPL
jgi:hypothetical protein